MCDRDNSKSEKNENVTLEVMEELELSNSEVQQARAFLRERFLRFMNGCTGREATFYLHENSQVTGEFRGVDVDFNDIFVSNMITALGKVPEAILRATDVISFDVKNIPSSSSPSSSS